LKTSLANHRKSYIQNTRAITKNSSNGDGLVVDQTIKSLAATYMNFNDLKEKADFSKERRSHSPLTISQVIQEDESPSKSKDIEKLIKRLNKPEMLLLNHL